MEGHKCEKEREFGEITTAIRFFQEAEVRRESREERMISAMESVAIQGEAIKNLQDASLRHDKALGEAFTRLRKVENPSLLLKLTRTKVGRVVLAAAALMSIIGWVKNPEALGKFLNAVIK